MKLSILKKHFPSFLFGYHLVFAFVAWAYVTENNGDAVRYWLVGQDLSHKSWFSFFQPGTDVIKIITFPLVKYLQLPFWFGFLLFSLIGYYGFYRLWLLILSLTENSRTAFWVGILLLFLPNLHLWTSFIGKEPILFVALVVMTEKLLRKQLLSIPFVLSFLLISLIRPHVAIILLLSVMIAYFWKGGLSRKEKGYLSLITAVSLAGLYLVIRKIAFITANPWDRILHIYHYHIEGLKKTAAYVPLDEYSLPYKIFTFYFRPLPFEKTGWLYQLWSFENLIFLLLCGAVLGAVGRNFRIIKWDFYEIFTIFAVFLVAVMYVYAYANYGLIARTKIMTMPFIYMYMVKVLSQIEKVQLQKDTQSEV